LNADAYWPSKPYGPEKNQNLKAKMSESYHFENENRHFLFLNFLKM